MIVCQSVIINILSIGTCGKVGLFFYLLFFLAINFDFVQRGCISGIIMQIVQIISNQGSIHTRIII